MSTGKTSTGKTTQVPPNERQKTEENPPHLSTTKGVRQKPSLPGPSEHLDARVLRFKKVLESKPPVDMFGDSGSEANLIERMPYFKGLGKKVHLEMLNELLDESNFKLFRRTSFENYVGNNGFKQCGDIDDDELTCYQKILASAEKDGMDQAQAAQHIENFYNAMGCKSFKGEYRCDKNMASLYKTSGQRCHARQCTPKKGKHRNRSTRGDGHPRAAAAMAATAAMTKYVQERKRGGKKTQRGGASAFVVRSLTCLTILASVFGTGYTFMLILYFFGFDVIARNVAARSQARVEGCGDPVDGLNRHFTRRAFETWLDGPPGEGGVGMGGRDCSTEWVDLQGSGDRALERIMGYVAYFRLIAAGAGLYAYDAIYNFINAQLDSWGVFPSNNPHNLGGGNKPTRRRRRKKRGGRKKTKRKGRKGRKGRKSRKRRSTKRKRKSRKH